MTCGQCGRSVGIGDWPFCPHGLAQGVQPAVHSTERAVVWRHPGTGQIRYPGRNDSPMPQRYQLQGFERHELPTLRAVEHFEKDHGVHNEKMWFDRNGHGFDDA